MISSITSTAWRGVVPPEWRPTRVKRIADFSPSFSDGKPLPNEECTVVPMEAVSEFGTVSVEMREFFSDVTTGLTNFENGDVLFAKITPCMENGKGACVENLTTRYALGSTEFHVLRPRHGADAKFLYYTTFNPFFRSWAEKNMHGAAGQQRVPTRFLKYTDLALPPLPEQKRIAAYLDASCAAIDRAVETKKKQLETLDALRKSIIQKAVTQGLNPKAKMKESGVEWLGQVPEHWKIEKLKRCGRLKGGAGFPHDEQGVTDAEIPFYKVKHLQSTRYLNECDNFVSVETAKKLGAEIMPSGTIVFAKVGAALLLNRFRILTRPSCIDNNMMALIIEKNCYRIPYFYYLLNLLDVGEFANQGPVPSINGSQVGVIRVPIPPTNEQDEIVAFVEKKAELFQCIYRNITTQITTLVAYRKSLIHECVTGKRRIADADVAGIQSNTDGHR